jgi:flavodoxin
MKAAVIFDTKYGNTEKIARSIETGLKATGIQTVCVNVKDTVAHSLEQYDLICVGGPTQYQTASKTMRDFLQSLKGTNISGKLAFAFDTKRDSLFAGSAAGFIEGRLRALGLKIVKPRLSAIIINPGPEKKREEFESKDEWKEWRHKNERLQEGEEKRFEQV